MASSANPNLGDELENPPEPLEQPPPQEEEFADSDFVDSDLAFEDDEQMGSESLNDNDSDYDDFVEDDDDNDEEEEDEAGGGDNDNNNDDNNPMEIEEEEEEGEASGAQLQLDNHDALPDCPICILPWTTDGPHRICCIPCGHVYGRSCLDKWFHQHLDNSNKCPQCHRKFKEKEIINLYAPVVKVPDDDLEELLSLRKENEMLKLKFALERAAVEERDQHLQEELDGRNLRLQRLEVQVAELWRHQDEWKQWQYEWKQCQDEWKQRNDERKQRDEQIAAEWQARFEAFKTRVWSQVRCQTDPTDPPPS